MSKYLSIDVGGTNIKYAILDGAGQIIFKDKCATPTADLTSFMAAIYQIIDQFKADINGIALSAPGKVDVKAKTIYYGGSLPFLHGACLQELIEDKYHLPVAVENDGKAAALAEMWLGTLKDIKNGAVVVLGTGVGGGLVVDSKLVRGTHFQAGELSFIIGSPLKPINNGMLGSVGSAVKMVTRINQALKHPDEKDGLAAFAAIKQGNPTAITIFKEYCRQIAILIFNIQAVVDLQKIAIGGGISSQPLVVETINEQYFALLEELGAFKQMITPPEIVKARFENDANLYGALYGLLLQLNHEEI